MSYWISYDSCRRVETRAYANERVGQFLDNRSKLHKLNSINGLDNLQLKVLCFCFLDWYFGRRMMLLVTDQHVIYQRAIRGKACTDQLKAFRVPELRFFKSLHLCFSSQALSKYGKLGSCDLKPNLCTHTEIADYHKSNLWDETLFEQKIFISRYIHQIIHAEGIDLHHIPDVNSNHRVTLVQVPQHTSHVRRILIIL